jgi:hypothetical protein
MLKGYLLGKKLSFSKLFSLFVGQAPISLRPVPIFYESSPTTVAMANQSETVLLKLSSNHLQGILRPELHKQINEKTN